MINGEFVIEWKKEKSTPIVLTVGEHGCGSHSRVKKLYRKTYKYASEIIQIGAVLLDEGFNRKRGIKDDKNYIRQYM